VPRYRRPLIGALVAFVALETPLLLWLVSTRTMAHTASLFAEPAVLMMLVDFTFVVGIVFAWMLLDARARGSSAWLWLPALVALPTAALLGYLLRHGAGRLVEGESSPPTVDGE